MSLQDVVRWLVDEVTKDGHVAVELVDELKSKIDASEEPEPEPAPVPDVPVAEPAPEPVPVPEPEPVPVPEPESAPEPASDTPIYEAVLTGPAPTGAQMAEPVQEVVTPDAEQG